MSKTKQNKTYIKEKHMPSELQKVASFQSSGCAHPVLLCVTGKKKILYRPFDFHLNNANVCDMICLLQS